MKKVLLFLFLIVLNFQSSIAQKVLHPYNLDFEDGELNRMPIGWIHPTYSQNNGYKSKLTDFLPQSGKYCLEISRDTTGFVEGMYGSVMQSVEAKPFQGKKMIFRAAVKAQITSKKGSAHLWIRVKLKNDEDGNVDLTENQPIIIGEWKFYQMELEINDYADQINYGLMLDGGGTAWIDNVSISSSDDKAISNFKTKELSKDELIDLYSFGRIYGELRYFHPSTVAQKLDWDKFGIYGIQKMLEKGDRFEKLDEIFNIVAPSLTLSEINRTKEIDNTKVIEGIEIGYLRFITSFKNIYDSKPVNVYLPQREVEGTVSQLTNISALNLKKIKLKFKVKYLSSSFNAIPQVMLRLDDEKDKVLKLVSFVDIPGDTQGWKEFAIESDVPQNTTFLRIGLSLAGDGEVFFDCLSASGIDLNNKSIDVSLKNQCFEIDEPGKLNKGWKLANVSEKNGYKATIELEDGNKILKISSNPAEKVNVPLPAERRQYSDDIMNFSFSFPLTLPVDSNSLTVPYSKDFEGFLAKIKKFEFDPADYNSRISAVINIWNYLIHFHINNIVYKNEILIDFIDKAAKAKDMNSFNEILNELIANSNDAQARVWIKNEERKFALPFLIKKSGESYFVGKSLDKEIKEGSKIDKINGIAASEFFASKLNYISGNNPEYKYLRAIAEFRSGNLNDNAIITINNKEYKVGKNILINSLSEERPSEVSLIDSTIYYIDLTRLNDDEIKSNLKLFVGAKKIIFDLRGITQISDHFLGLFLDKNVESFVWKVPGYAFPMKRDMSYKILTNIITTKKVLNAECVFLIDSRSIGYSEVLAELIKKYNIGKLIGEETAGAMGESIPLNYHNTINMSVTGLLVLDGEKNKTFSTVKPDKTIKYIQKNGIFEDSILEYATEYFKMKHTK